jgi:hypothetical protein
VAEHQRGNLTMARRRILSTFPPMAGDYPFSQLFCAQI